MNKTLKLLFLSASPDRLRADQELRDISEEIRKAPYGAAFDVVAEWAVRTRDVQGILQKQKAQIVHFSGHGRDSKGIFLEDEIGKPVAVNARAMRGLFEPLRGITQVLILNACETRPLAEALRGIVPSIITMRRPITDRAAIVFSTQFYSSLGHGLSVRDAFHAAVTQLCMGDTLSEADIPDLVSSEEAVVGPMVQPPREEPRRDGSRVAHMNGVTGQVVINTAGDNNSTSTTVKGRGNA